MSGPSRSPSRSVVAGMARRLAESGVGQFAETGPLDTGPAAAVPITAADAPPDGDAAIILTTYAGGPEPDMRNGWEYPRLQVRVRSENPLAALDLDRACFDVFHGARGPLPGTAWWLQDCYALQSDAEPLGADANGRHEFTRNYQLSTELTA